MAVAEQDLLALAEEAARAGGVELMQRFGREPVDVRTKSTPTDPVSAADVASERAIRRLLDGARPDDLVLGEEGGERRADAGAEAAGALRWVVDPLDGTVNFLYGIPQFAVSIACEDGAGTLLGVVLDPVRDECFSASRSTAPRLNGRPLPARAERPLARTLVATGFAYEADVRALQAQAMTRVLPRVRDIRRAGAAALDLCWCACGRLDAYFERSLRLWDVAAGALICARAGLVVRELLAVGRGGDQPGLPAGLIAAPPTVVDELEALVAGAAPAGQ